MRRGNRHLSSYGNWIENQIEHFGASEPRNFRDKSEKMNDIDFEYDYDADQLELDEDEQQLELDEDDKQLDEDEQ